MSKLTTNIEWYTAQDDADWARLYMQPLPSDAQGAAPAAQDRLFLKQFLGGVVALLLLLLSTGQWWWRTEQAVLPQAAANMTATAQPALGAITSGRDALVGSLPGDQAAADGQEVHESRLAIENMESPVYVFEAVQSFEVQGDLAVARVVMYTEYGEPAYRQTRFYQHTTTAWVPTTPDATLWGPERSLETPSFVFHFRQHDAPAVIAVAPQVEELYAMLRRNFGLPLTAGAEKLIIEVSVTQPPGHTAPWDGGPEPFLVPSPAVYLAPVELTDAELLEQSIALPLLDQVLAQASERYGIKADWQPMLDGLRLWQVWDMALPLAVWRDDVVQWIYLDLPTTAPGQSLVLPEHYTELCTAHKRWLSSPVYIGIPLLCADLVGEGETYHEYPLNPPTHLDQLAMPVNSNAYQEESSKSHQAARLGQTVAVATLIEYAVITYGRERLPALGAGLGRYNTWDALLPPVFGVSAPEFEAGWQAYLTAHYGVPMRP